MVQEFLQKALILPNGKGDGNNTIVGTGNQKNTWCILWSTSEEF